ncbi:O-antigen ligase family protein [Natronococcus occultus]|uniref:O-antigen ligase family protein n=1 Tax=Natronococcus occultus TaxID=29288 RepID=UPI001FDF88B3|nr:O-antigen ligase domain-containing protein [Natronococcus occultus]
MVVHYSHSPHIEILQYILVTPLAVFTTVVILPALIDGRRQVFTMGITLITVVSSLIGIVVLWQEPSELSRYIGSPVLGIGNLRTTSIFHNPNTYGFFMMAGSLAALYTYLTRRGAVWLGALGLCLLGLFMSGGDAAFVGFVAGAVLVLSGPDYRFGFFGLLFAVVGVYIAIQLGHVTDVMEGTLMQRVDRWVASLERLAQNPLLGIGFANTASQIGEEIGPHNSYIYPLLNTGIIAGGFYLGALIYALGQGLRTWWTPWTGFVVGLTVAIFLYMGFESLFLGGLSVSSILLGLSLGLLLYSSETRHSWLGTQNR